MPKEVWLLDTSEPGSPGSMARYASDVVSAIERADSEGVWLPRRINLDKPREGKSTGQSRLSPWIRHARLWRAVSGLHVPADAIVHILDGSHAYLARAFPNRRRVITSHDLIPLRQQERIFGERKVSLPARWLIKSSLKQVRSCHKVLSDSKSTRSDLVNLGKIPPGKIQVVPLVVSLSHQGMPVENREPEILHVSNNAFYKNRTGAIRIFEAVRQNHDVRMRVVGPPPSDELAEWLKLKNLTPHIRFESDLTEKELREAYQSATLLLFPSLYEGFGWPPLEAMANGCPVVCSSEGSLPEVGGDAALMAPACDETALADHCIRLLRDDELRAECIRRGYEHASKFSLQAMGEKLIKVYEEVAAS